MDLNKVMLIGRLTRDPEVRTTPSGQMVATMSIATSRQWVDRTTNERKSQTEYHNVVLWRRLAEIASQYLKKGRQIYVEGYLQTRSWDDQNSTKRYRTEVVADNIIMLGSGGDGGGMSTNSSAGNTTTTDQQPEEEVISIDDIPF